VLLAAAQDALAIAALAATRTSSIITNHELIKRRNF
jgi:hypothetical protein